MTENENKKLNIAVIGGGRSVGRTLKAQLDLYAELESYRTTGTVEEFKALKEKAEPKKVLFEKQSYGTQYLCPSCGADQCKVEFLAEDGSEVEKKHSYCWICGQVIDWSDEE